ncbi:hypothetical protein HK098_003924 [Nowakowskiella sp. JEL0407]|nr:hypothetical protein HK098_003924 [Nowakowskiella sp. JEL0407]
MHAILHSAMLPPSQPSPVRVAYACTPHTAHPVYGDFHFAQTRLPVPILPDLLPLTSSAPVSAPPASSSSALLLAASSGDSVLVRNLIVEDGAVVDFPDKDGETALMKASYRGHSEVASFLISKAANVNQFDCDGWTSLHNAASKGFLEICRMLIDSGSNVNALSQSGYTPLMNASAQGHLQVVELLISKNSNPLLKTSRGETAYDLATQNEQVTCAQLLESYELEYLSSQNQSVAEYNPETFHQTRLEIIFENQRSGFFSDKFEPCDMVRDHWPPLSTLFGKEITFDLVTLPATANEQQQGWFWLTDWKVDMTDPCFGVDGWSYARNFSDPNSGWVKSPVSGLQGVGVWVRRRRWIRVRKKRLDSDSKVEDSPVEHVEESTSYIDRAKYVITGEKSRIDELEDAIQILLVGMKVDKNPDTKKEAAELVKEYLDEAEKLMDDTDQYVPPEIRQDTVSKASPPVENFVESGELIFDVEESQGSESTTSAKINIETPVTEDDTPEPSLFSTTPPASGMLNAMKSPPRPIPTLSPPRNSTTTTLSAPSSFVTSNLSQPIFRERGKSFSNQISSSFDNLMRNVREERGSSSGSSGNFLDERRSSSRGEERRVPPMSMVRESRWQLDEDAPDCNQCKRKFTLFLRRHHCRFVNSLFQSSDESDLNLFHFGRWCGLVYCDKCTNARISLSQVDTSPQRVCDLCFEYLVSPRSWLSFPPQISALPLTSPLLNYNGDRNSRVRVIPVSNIENFLNSSSSWPGNMLEHLDNDLGGDDDDDDEPEEDDEVQSVDRRSMTGSIMNECPVCGLNLTTFKSEDDAAAHVDDCLMTGGKGGSGKGVRGDRYIG